jgi:hypothetical protein
MALRNREIESNGRNLESVPTPKGGGAADKVARYGWKMTSAPGEAALISKHALRLDLSYQRETTLKKVRHIASDWSWIACGALIVARRPNGDLYVVDGGHRLLAAQGRSDIQELPCILFDVMDATDESGGFIAANQKSRKMSAYDLLRAELHNGDETAIAITRIVESSGMRFLQSKTDAWDGVRCIGAMKRCAASASSMNVLKIVWPVIAETAAAERKPMTDRMLYGYHYIESRLIANKSPNSLTRNPWRGRVVALGCVGATNAACKAAAFYTAGGPRVYATGILQALNRQVRNKLVFDPAEDEE